MSLLNALFIPPIVPSRLQQLVLNQAIITSVRETIEVEVFDKGSLLTELYTFNDMAPIHVIYLLGFIWVLYSQLEYLSKEIDNKEDFDIELFEIERRAKFLQLLKNGYSIRRNIRILFFTILFIFTKNVEHVS